MAEPTTPTARNDASTRPSDASTRPESGSPRNSASGNPPRRGPLAWLTRITHLGVDPALPRHETKHIVLTNQWALFSMWCFAGAMASPSTATLLPEVRAWHPVGLIAALLTLALNAARRPTAASFWILSTFLVEMVAIGRLEPLETEHVGFFIVNAAVALFLFPTSRRGYALAIAVVSSVVALAFPWWLRTHPPPTPSPDFDIELIAFFNNGLTLVTLLFFCGRAVTETARVERELVAERQRSESLLKREVAHQVAERSREMGAALSRPEGPMTPASLAGSTRFGARYQIVRPLGEGGMGAVFEVERKTDGQHLALKVMTGHVSREHATRFAREAEIGARIHDPHLVSIVDVGVADGGAPFLVMELVTGGSLEQQRQRFGDVAWALPILRHVARALVALHEAGVVHRDLKPGNVLIDMRGDAKVSDFGIARFGPLTTTTDVDASAPTAAGVVPASRDLTGTGAWIGTPLYMAPEAARGGRDVGAPADLFAFGILAHEMLTGRSPFTTPAVLLALASQPLPKVREFNVAGISPAARDAIRSCLAAEPARRPDARRLLATLAG